MLQRVPGKRRKSVGMKITVSAGLLLLACALVLFGTVDDRWLPMVSSTGRIHVICYGTMFLLLPLVLMWLPGDIRERSKKQKIIHGLLLGFLLFLLVFFGAIGIALLMT